MLLTAFCFASSLFLIAQTDTRSDPASWQSQGWIIAGIFALIGSANQGMALWERLFPRKSPPDHELYASKAEVLKIELAHKHEMVRIERRFSEWLEQNDRHHNEEMKLLGEWKDEMKEWQLDVERSLGKVETKADAALRPRRS